MSSTLVPILNFSEITKSDLSKIGLKASSIGEMFRAKVPIPQGFVITSESYFYFLDMARIREKIVEILSSLDVSNTKELEEASNLIQDIIIKATIPPAVENAILKSYSRLSGFMNTFVAVRSSMSYDDDSKDVSNIQSATFLNIKGGKDVVLASKACWASLFEAQQIEYRAKNGISHMKIGMSVIIQRMVQADVSGIVFTQNPVNNDSSKIIVEAVLGLTAEGIKPDHYEIDKSQLNILSKDVSVQNEMIIRSLKHKENEDFEKKVQVAQKWQNAQKLDDRKISDIARIAKVLEQHFGEPQSIEWTIENNKIFIIQTTSINNPNFEEKEEMHEEAPVVHVEAVQSQVEEQSVIEEKTYEEEPKKQEGIPAQEYRIILSGSPASEGVAEGHVKVIRQNDDFINLNTGDILVIDKISPDYILWMRKSGGIIVNQGSSNIEAISLSREFKIPCIIGTINATEILKDGQYIQINGTTGRVYSKQEFSAGQVQEQHEEIIKEVPKEDIQTPQTQVFPEIDNANVPEEIADFEQQGQIQAVYEREELKEEEQSQEAVYPKNVKTATKIYMNLSDPNSANFLATKESDGIGYINGTYILNSILGKHPEQYIEEEIIEKYVTDLSSVLDIFCKNFNPKTIIYRPSNLISSELSVGGEDTEKNPMLGYNGAIKYIQNPSILNLEIEAIKTTRNKSGYKNLSIMLPMIRDTRELREIKKIITSNDLKRSSTFKIYLSIESPSTILLINELLEIGIDGIFIMANTLSGFLNATDLTNPKYQSFPIFNSAFMLSSEVVIKTAHKNKIPTGIILEKCEFNEDALKQIIEWGAISISVDPEYIEKTRIKVAEIEKSLILSRRK